MISLKFFRAVHHMNLLDRFLDLNDKSSSTHVENMLVS